MTIKQTILKFSPNFVVREYLKFKSRWRMRGYEGYDVECPVCESTFRIFASIGNPLRENAKCMKCDLVERGRLMWLYMNKKTDLLKCNSKIKLLHFAPEKIFYEKFSNPQHIE